MPCVHLAFLGCLVAGLAQGRAPPGTGTFESAYRTHESASAAREQLAGRQKAAHSANGTLDVRVTKALGSKGYNALRISVITDGPQVLTGDLKFEYEAPFQYRWQTAYDMGTEKASCGKGVYESSVAAADANCLQRCSSDSKCKFYTWRDSTKMCDLSADCTYEDDNSAVATYEKVQTNYLHSTVVQAVPGINTYTINGQSFSVNLPAENSPTGGIIWSDPCISSRWIQCKWGLAWSTFERSYEMLNALAEDDSWHFFQILGDNFYDQDGRITKSMYDQFSLKTKSKILYTVSGNHDLWVCGGPECGDKHDQFGYGLAQFYAQDTMSSKTHNFLDFSINPDAAQKWSELNNSPGNLFWYNKIGSIGFIGYSGGATFEESLADFQEACSYMSGANVDHVILLGHWDDRGMGCAPDMSVPAVFDKLQTLPGCNIGDKLKAFDGHTHCNHVQESKSGEASIFMIGAHGMAGCSQYGFAYLEASQGQLHVYYFEERSATSDNYAAILSCVREKGVANCKEHASAWLALDTEIYA